MTTSAAGASVKSAADLDVLLASVQDDGRKIARLQAELCAAVRAES